MDDDEQTMCNVSVSPNKGGRTNMKRINKQFTIVELDTKRLKQILMLGLKLNQHITRRKMKPQEK